MSSAKPAAGPSVFISYRRADTEAVAIALADHLRTDLGASSVFRDKDDLIAGQVWQDRLTSAMAESDCAIFLVGPEWEAHVDGRRRIDDDDDPVGREVRQALDDTAGSTPIPVLIDLDQPPAPLPPVDQLFDRHAVFASRESLQDELGSGYQQLLVGIWESIRESRPRGVVIIGDHHGLARVDAVVEELRQARLIDARAISRYAAGACIVTPRRLRKGARRWPDAIVLVDDEQPSEALATRLRAVDEHPGLRNVSLLGSGIAAGFALGSVIGGATSSTVFAASTHVAPAIPQIGTGPIAGATTALATGSRAARWAAGAALAVTATTAVAVADPFSSGSAGAAPYGYLEVQLTSLAEDADARETLGVAEDAVVVRADVDVENLTRGDDMRIRPEYFTLRTGGEVAVARFAEARAIDVPPEREESLDLFFVFPSDTEVDDPQLLLREDGGEPLDLTDPPAGPDTVPITMVGEYDTQCRLIQFGPGFASSNAGITAEGDPRPAPNGTDLGRAGEGEVIVSFDVLAAEKTCGPASFFTLTGGGINAVVAVEADGIPVTLGHQGIGQLRGQTRSGQVAFAVPDIAVETLRLDLDAPGPGPDVIELRADLTPIAELDPNG